MRDDAGKLSHLQSGNVPVNFYRGQEEGQTDGRTDSLERDDAGKLFHLQSVYVPVNFCIFQRDSVGLPTSKVKTIAPSIFPIYCQEFNISGYILQQYSVY